MTLELPLEWFEKNIPLEAMEIGATSPDAFRDQAADELVCVRHEVQSHLPPDFVV